MRSAGGSHRLRAVVRIHDFESECRTVADGLDDLLAMMADTKNNPFHTVPAQQAELVVQKWHTVNVHEAFGCLTRQWAESGGKAASEYRNRKASHCAITSAAAGYWAITLVPSKSNRNRTCSSPSAAIASRSRALSSQRNMRNPPPPAPISLPPRAPFFMASSYQ